MTALDALQTTLAQEHAALYSYGVLGARTSQSAAPALYAAVSTAYRQHRARRDRLRILIEEAGGVPVVAAPIYAVAEPLRQPEEIAAAGLELERSSTEALTALVAQTAGAVRAWALTETIWSGSWQLEFGGAPLTWPGAPELG